MLSGVASGTGAALPSSFLQATAGGDPLGALKNLGIGAVSGGIIGGVGDFAKDALAGAGDFVKGLGSSPSLDPLTGQVTGINPATSGIDTTGTGVDWAGIGANPADYGLGPGGVSLIPGFNPDLYRTGGSEVTSALGDEGGDVAKRLGIQPSADAVPDMWGRSPIEGDYDYDPSTEFDRISDINHPDNWDQYIKDLYRTGNTEMLSALGFITDSGASLGIKPSNTAIPSGGGRSTLPSMDINPQDLIGRALGLVGTNDGEPLGDFPPTTAMLPNTGRAEFMRSGVNPIDVFSNQYGAVRSEGAGHAQDLISMVQENPELLNNPEITKAIEAMLGGPIKPRFGEPAATGLEGVMI